MAEIQQINFAVNSYQSRSRIASSERVVNAYAENTPSDSPFRAANIFNTPGLKPWLAIESFNPIYGELVMGDFLYAVVGLTLYQISKTKTVTELGTLGTTPAPVQMTENGIQVTILTTSGNSYYYDIDTDTFGQITDPDYELASSVTTLDGYTVFSKIDSGQFFISALRDTTSYSALDFATAEALSDNIVGIVTYNRQLYIFGTNSIEAWYNNGGATFPFQRIDGALVQVGLRARASTSLETDGVYWLGSDGIVYKTKDYFPNRISTFAIEDAIESYDITNDATGYIYTQAGHQFYVLTFPSAKKTWVHDISTGLWHERSTLTPDQTGFEEWSPRNHAFFDNKNIVNGKKDGNLYELDLNTYKEDDVPIIRKLISATQFTGYEYQFIERLGIVMDFGVGLDGDQQGSNPKIMMRFSIDGGYTWSKETQSTIGSIGSYPTELYWDTLGKCRSIIIEITISDPVKFTVIGAYLKTKKGAF